MATIDHALVVGHEGLHDGPRSPSGTRAGVKSRAS